MSFDRPTLSELRALVEQDIAASLPGSDPLLRNSNLNILGTALAGLTHLQYGFLDYISRQAVPSTSEGPWLRMWGALKGISQLPPNSAGGYVAFPGVNGQALPAGTPLTRADGKTFTTLAEGIVTAGQAVVPALADPDPQGLTGAWGNMDVGAQISLGRAVSGISSTGHVSTAFVGGADLEAEDAFRDRVLQAFRQPARGGSASDYETWAGKVPGVTRAWCPPSVMGPGTVQVFVMLDDVQASHGGFPQGTNGVATAEARGVAATGDQLAVANAIYTQRPVTALVYVVSPTAYACNFTITGLSTASVATKAAVSAAISGVLRDSGQLAGTVALSEIEAAVASVPGTAGFVITNPTANLAAGAGQIHTLGVITWA